MKLSPINVSKLSVMLLPTFMRTVSIVEFFRIVLIPFNYVQDAFFTNRAKNIYQLTHNGQVCYLRAVLNDAFPGISKSFLIEDILGVSGQWQFCRDEDRIFEQLIVPDEPDFILLYDEERMSIFSDFVVKIPSELASEDNMNRIRSIVNTYKLVSKKATYEYY